MQPAFNIHDPGPDVYVDWHTQYAHFVNEYAHELGVDVLPSGQYSLWTRDQHSCFVSPYKAAHSWVDAAIADLG